jgi:hypothetical protein
MRFHTSGPCRSRGGAATGLLRHGEPRLRGALAGAQRSRLTAFPNRAGPPTGRPPQGATLALRWRRPPKVPVRGPERYLRTRPSPIPQLGVCTCSRTLPTADGVAQPAHRHSALHGAPFQQGVQQGRRSNHGLAGPAVWRSASIHRGDPIGHHFYAREARQIVH